MKNILILLLVTVAVAFSCEKKEEEGFKVESFVDHIEVETDRGLTSSLYTGDFELFPYHLDFKIKVVCRASNCGYSVNGVTYTQTKTFLK